jgi:lipopolysaccharide/colanic/teichoic acid biosynthesis glycosyltransferase
VLYRKYFKRFLDLLLAVIFGATFSWLFFLIIIIYCIAFQFPIFFKQERIGRHERSFWIIKFRTLRPSKEALHKRRFFWGDLLRVTSLDELPQIWNVMKGEMSLVGPRPLPVAYLPLFSAAQRPRHTVRPGITGWAQVLGSRGISWEQKFVLDVYYVQHMSLWLDVKIMWMTIVLLLTFRRGVALDEKPFTGADSAN